MCLELKIISRIFNENTQTPDKTTYRKYVDKLSKQFVLHLFLKQKLFFSVNFSLDFEIH